jgi:acyl dehydratase
MPAIFRSVADFNAGVGQQLGPTEWLRIDQERINAFAEATDDHQWIHVDTERAKAGPYGATIAHGYLTLSLVSHFLPELIRPVGMKQGINYGCDRVRFPSVVRSGTRVRARAEILGSEEVSPGVAQVKVRVSIESEGGDRPACVADTLSRFYFQ